MRYPFESETFAKTGPIVQQLNDTAIIGLEKYPQDQYREKLVVCKIFAGIMGRVGGKAGFGNTQGLLCQRHRRFGHSSCGFHVPYIDPYIRICLRFSTEQASNKMDFLRKIMVFVIARSPDLSGRRGNLSVSNGRDCFAAFAMTFIMLDACSVENLKQIRIYGSIYG